METKHTAGPWAVARNNPQKVVSDRPTGGIVATTSDWWHSTTESEANAHLIAAAPDLLAALEELARVARYYHTGEIPGNLDACENPDCCGHCLAMRKVNAAIAKARGDE